MYTMSICTFRILVAHKLKNAFHSLKNDAVGGQKLEQMLTYLDMVAREVETKHRPRMGHKDR